MNELECNKAGIYATGKWSERYVCDQCHRAVSVDSEERGRNLFRNVWRAFRTAYGEF